MLKKIVKSTGAYRLEGRARKIYQDSRYYLRDLKNIARYGIGAPRCFETIWINPYECRYFLPINSVTQMTGIGPRKSTAIVVSRPWERCNLIPVTELDKFSFCFQHWVKGIPWSETGAYDSLLNKICKRDKKIDNCKTGEDIARRYSHLDTIFSTVNNSGLFQTQIKLKPNNFRERGGVLIHIGPEGELFFGGSGCHRLSIALILGIYIPAALGCIHESALEFLPEMRKKKSGRAKLTEHFLPFFEREQVGSFLPIR